MNNERLGHILLKEGLINVQQLDFCLSVQKNNGRQRLGKIFSHYSFVSERAIAQALASQVGWKVFEGDYVPDQEVVSLLGIDFLKKRMVFPVRFQDDVLFVLSKADDIQTTDFITKKLDRSVIFYLGLESSLRNALEALSNLQLQDQNQQIISVDRLDQWFEGCLNKAIDQSASDVHIEPSQKVVEIRFREDGILNFIETLPLKYLSKLVNIIFHRAEVTISDFGHFHDAKFIYQYLNRQVDIRVSHIPSVHGSSLVLRLLDKGKTAIPLSQLGYGPKPWKLIQDNLSKPEGITLVVGPTGCGKTTTLYAMLNYLKSIDTKIVTIEDPIEIQLPLMTQVQVNEKRGVSFSQSVRAMLRHDPDIILIGEIRDELTAQEALRAAMTGHKVFTTLHTNRAFDALLRLHDLGLPYSHMADHLSMIVAQRLVRKLNSEGKFEGQTVVAEVLVVNELISEFVAKGDLIGLKKFLRENDYQTMSQDAARLVSAGITTQEEINRVLG